MNLITPLSYKIPSRNSHVLTATRWIYSNDEMQHFAKYLCWSLSKFCSYNFCRATHCNQQNLAISPSQTTRTECVVRDVLFGAADIASQLDRGPKNLTCWTSHKHRATRCHFLKQSKKHNMDSIPSQIRKHAHNQNHMSEHSSFIRPECTDRISVNFEPITAHYIQNLIIRVQ